MKSTPLHLGTPTHPWRQDGFAKARGPGLGFMLGATTYLYDVQHRGGGFCFWPRTHVPAWRYFADHQEMIEEGGKFEEVVGGAPQPIEFTGEAGDCVLWHNMIFRECTNAT